MSATEHYKSNLRDIFFNLFEFLDIGRRTLGQGPFAHLDEASMRESLAGLEAYCRKEFGTSYVDLDREPPTLGEDGTPHLPEALKRAVRGFQEGGWDLLEVPVNLGGVGAPPTVTWAGFELASGSNASAAFYGLGNFLAKVLDRLGTPSQKERFLPHLVERRWGGAMVLTEPDAGSDVGAGRTRARQVEGDLWALEGTKRFITSADQDMTENVIHFVLARPEGAGPGTRGLSLFVVPKYLVNEDGSPGERNGWTVTGLEKKLGIKASVTCEVAYGGAKPALGWLLGDRHDGIRQMFHVIEYARMAVGVKSLAGLSTGYLNALAYARERVQGPDLARANDKASPRVTILQHPDVRRMLLSQKAHAEGLRALCAFTAHVQDRVELAGGHGVTGDDLRNDLLLPLVKGYASETAWTQLTLSLQTLGGSGYVEDYPIAQYLRDQKIDSVYEGTTHIQALDLVFRKVGKDGGATLNALLSEVEETLRGAEGGEALATERALLATAVGDLQGLLGALLGKLGESVYHVGLHANRALTSMAQVLVAWLLVRHAALALRRLPEASPADRAFYQGKVASARFYCREVLPEVALARGLVERSDLTTMEVPAESF
ncbi:MAG: acyl-CoA dehydrogenase [Deltaproteobacteria bacterium]|nr:acyl-CoA dehydrogenase [Deltaproteobacteria bacterium]